jgi:acyl-CoA thioesterase-2
MAGFAGVLELTESGIDNFQGAPSGEGGTRVYGGHTAAQSLLAGMRTVEPDWESCFLHTQYPRAGDPALPIDYRVERISTSRNFELRHVVASQAGKTIAASTVSLQLPYDGLDFQSPTLPAVAAPETLESEAVLFAAAVRERHPEGAALQFLPSGIDARWTGPQDMLRPSVRDAANPMWMRVTEEIGDTVQLRQLALAYCSDFGMIEPSLRVHGFSFLEPENLLASTISGSTGRPTYANGICARRPA